MLPLVIDSVLLDNWKSQLTVKIENKSIPSTDKSAFAEYKFMIHGHLKVVF
jgi:hypothetical protein